MDLSESMRRFVVGSSRRNDVRRDDSTSRDNTYASVGGSSHEKVMMARFLFCTKDLLLDDLFSFRSTCFIIIRQASAILMLLMAACRCHAIARCSWRLYKEVATPLLSLPLLLSVSVPVPQSFR
jgi:hypothetical protein